MNAIGVRVTLGLAPLMAVVWSVMFLTTRHAAFVALVGVSAIAGAAAFIASRHSSRDASLLLVLAGLSTVIAAFPASRSVQGVLVAALVLFAVVGVLVVPDRSRRRMISSAPPLLILQAMVIGRNGEVAEAVATAAIGTAALTVGLFAAHHTRSHLDRSERTRLEQFRRVPVGLFRIDLEGRIVDANPALADILGYDDVARLSQLSAEALYVDPADWHHLDQRLHSTREPQRFAHRLRRTDGATVWVRGFVQSVWDEAGVVYHEGTFENITQRRQVEEDSKRNAERFRNVFERAPIALWEEDFSAVQRRLEALRARGVTDIRSHLDDGDELNRLLGLIRYVDVNPAGVALLGASSKQEAIATVVPDEPPPLLMASFIEQFAAIWEDRDQISLDVEGSAVDGTPLDVALHWAATRDPEGRLDVSRVIVAIADVGPIRSAERELEALVASKDELVASVSHELRTPITTIMGMALELRDHTGEFNSEESADLIALVADQSRELSDIVEDLLVAARADTDSLAVRPEVLPIRREVEQLVATTAPGLEPEISIPVGLRAWADPLRFRQIVRNLLTNAVRYGGDSVVIRADDAGEEIWLEVEDDGEGVAEADHEAIFEPYIRAAKEAGLPGSIGLGLPVSRRLARLMGGELFYRFDGRSAFVLRLPAPVASQTAYSVVSG